MTSRNIISAAMISLLFYVNIIVPKPIYASPRSLYVIAGLRQPVNPVQVYNIQPPPICLVYQKTQYIPLHGSGAIDLTVDSQSQTLFITYEYCNLIQILNATTFADLGNITIQGVGNLAGIVYDHNKSRVYIVGRATNDLYVLQWDAATHVLTFDSHVNLTYSSKAYGIALDETSGTLYVADGEYSRKFDLYDTDTWVHLKTRATTHTVIGIAVDAKNRFVYTSGGMRQYPPHDYGLYKYDMIREEETAVLNNPSGIHAEVLDVEVDQDTSLVYVTTFWDGSWDIPPAYRDVLIVFDSNLNELRRSGNIGNPVGLAILRGEISYTPPSSSGTEYLWAAILGVVGCSAGIGVFFIYKRKKGTMSSAQKSRFSQEE